MDKIKSIGEVQNLQLGNVGPLNGSSGSRLGISQMLSALGGYGSYDGYRVVTDNNTYHVLIDNGQSCCESWGYVCSEDDPQQFVGADLLEVVLTDTALQTAPISEAASYLDEGGIQFVDFKTDKGTFQLAVYNGHNGYYGHSIIIAKNVVLPPRVVPDAKLVKIC
ncbi:MAG: hypothetical protein GXY32_04930 [Ruminococcaceae bacterium]|nr:hypothetical protein [Oscillospiraceae bacterium]